MGGEHRSSSAAYFREYRARRKAEGRPVDAGRDRRRSVRAPEDRRREYQRRPSRAGDPIPDLHSGHPLFDQARVIVGPRRTSLVSLHDPLYDDLLSVAVLAILEGTDPTLEVAAYGSRERSYGRITAPIFDD